MRRLATARLPRVAPAPAREGDLTQAVIEATAACGGYVFRVNSGRIRTRTGWVHLAPEGTSDLIGWTRDGRFLAWELKDPRRVTRTKPERAAAQARFRAAVVRAGGVAAEVRSVDDVVRALRGMQAVAAAARPAKAPTITPSLTEDLCR